MKLPVTIRYVWAAALLSLFLFSCSEYGNELAYVREGKIHVQITDAPFPTDFIEEASITVVRIEARRKADSESSESTFETLFEGTETINLIELTNGVVRSMGPSGVPVGSYDQIRIYVTEAWVTTIEGEKYEVKVPGGSSSGIKVFVKPEIEVVEEQTADLLLDVDLSKSFVMRGNPQKGKINGLLFKPVVRASNLGYAGTLGGNVFFMEDEMEQPIAGAEVSLIVADTVYASALTDASGGYQILGILAGDYLVQAGKDGFIPSEPAPVQIEEGVDVNFDVVLEKEP